MSGIYRDGSWECGRARCCACCPCGSARAATCFASAAPRDDWARARRWLWASVVSFAAMGAAVGVPVAVAAHQLAYRDTVSLARRPVARATSRGPTVPLRTAASAGATASASASASAGGAPRPEPAAPAAPAAPVALAAPVAYASPDACQVGELARVGAPTHDAQVLLRRARFLREQGCDWTVLEAQPRAALDRASASGQVVAPGSLRLSDGTTVRGVRFDRPDAMSVAAGLAPGDLLTAVNGFRVGAADPLANLVPPAPARPGQPLVFELVRGGHHVALMVNVPRGSAALSPREFPVPPATPPGWSCGLPSLPPAGGLRSETPPQDEALTPPRAGRVPARRGSPSARPSRPGRAGSRPAGSVRASMV